MPDFSASERRMTVIHEIQRRQAEVAVRLRANFDNSRLHDNMLPEEKDYWSGRLAAKAMEAQYQELDPPETEQPQRRDGVTLDGFIDSGVDQPGFE